MTSNSARHHCLLQCVYCVNPVWWKVVAMVVNCNNQKWRVRDSPSHTRQRGLWTSTRGVSCSADPRHSCPRCPMALRTTRAPAGGQVFLYSKQLFTHIYQGSWKRIADTTVEAKRTTIHVENRYQIVRKDISALTLVLLN